jgi:hypothetical protein
LSPCSAARWANVTTLSTFSFSNKRYL